MNYPIVIHKDEDSDYGVIVPDLPGCFSAGSTIDEAVAMAGEAIGLHLEGLVENGEGIPEPGHIQQHEKDPDYRGGIWAIVSINPAHLRVAARRVNITMPERVLEAVDRFAKAHNETRSGLLVKAATAYISQRSARPGPSRTLRTSPAKKRPRVRPGSR